MKRVAFFLLGLVALAGGALVAGVLYLRSAHPETAGRLEVAGLGADVEVWRDTLGVPHIWAGTENDLFFAQGYVHAQDRLWQMELLRRVAEGRLAEVLGADLLASDIFLRTVGIWRAAGDQEEVLDTAARQTLEAYAAGVNAAIDGWSGALPPELVALGIRPEPWTVRHSLAVEKIMAWDLALYGHAAEATRSAAHLDSATLRALHQDYPAYGPTIIEPPPIPEAAAALLDGLSATRASNAWVIGGSRTISGKPILANDMHLALRAPSLWYLMALHGGRYDVAGMTLPGVPHVVAGHNRAIAWGFTNAMVDDADLFLERVDAADTTRYLVPGGSEAFQVIAEAFRVKGRDTVITERIRLTRHGPILPDVRDPAGRDLIALRWAAHDPSRSFSAVPALNRAASRAEFEAAVAEFDNPHQNVVYADTAGNFGYVMGGRIPARPAGRRPPTLPVPGWTGAWDWAGYLDASEHPRSFNPPQGYVVTANNRQAAGPAADRISTEWELPFRAARIREMVLADGPFDAAAVHAMQLDVRDAFAARYRDHAVAAYAAAGLDSVAASLRGWDLAATADSRVAPLFYVWYETLRDRTRRALFDGPGGALPRKSMNLVLDSGALFWRPDGKALLDSLARVAARAAVDVAAGRSWGDLHTALAEHPLARAELLDRFLHLNVGPAPAGGSPTTVNVSHYAGARFPVVGAYGPSQRHVVDMADVDGAGGFILPTGQSGLPFSDHYADQWPRWLNGGLWRIPLGRAAAEARAVQRLVLTPVRE
jgi:penicillin G amidase